MLDAREIREYLPHRFPFLLVERENDGADTRESLLHPTCHWPCSVNLLWSGERIDATGQFIEAGKACRIAPPLSCFLHGRARGPGTRPVDGFAHPCHAADVDVVGDVDVSHQTRATCNRAVAANAGAAGNADAAGDGRVVADDDVETGRAPWRERREL